MIIEMDDDAKRAHADRGRYDPRGRKAGKSDLVAWISWALWREHNGYINWRGYEHQVKPKHLDHIIYYLEYKDGSG